MNILHTVESYYPEVGGMAVVVRELSERLVKLGHHVTVATGKNPARKGVKKINGVKIKEFNISGKSVFAITGETENYQNFLKDFSFDIVTNFAGQQWASDLAIPILNQIKAKKIFVPTGFSGLYSPFYKNYYKKMKLWMKEYDMNIFLSENYRDINFARKNNITKIKVIPNGAGKDEFNMESPLNIRKILGIPNSSFLILTVGSHTGLKGHKEAIQIFNKASIKNATLLIIGKKTISIHGCYFKCLLSKFLSHKNILIKDLTREETVACFKTADLFLFPSNIECSPIVLFESIASKTPFLTTDVGNAKEIINLTKGGKILPTHIDKHGYSHALIDNSAKILRSCFHNYSDFKLMGKLGHKAWLKKYTWEIIAKEYEKLYQTLIHSRGITP